MIWLKYLAAAGPLLVGVFAGVIAWQNYRLQTRQHRLEREQFKFQIFDRRFAVYDSFRKAIELALSPVDENELGASNQAFQAQRGPVHFLFYGEQDSYFFAVRDVLMEMHSARLQMAIFQGSGQTEYDEANEQWKAARDKLDGMRQSLPQRFENYLRLSREFM